MLEPTIDDAVLTYQRRVDEWAAPALRESLGPVRVMKALRAPLAQVIARPALSVAGAIGAIIDRRSARP